MSDEKFPIALVRHFFTKFCIVANAKYAPTGETLPAPENNLTVAAVQGSSGDYVATQTVRMDGLSPAQPYSVDVECVGLFRSTESGSSEEQQRHVMIVANSVLYGACREAIAAATSRQAWGPLTLGLSVLLPRAKSSEPQPAEQQ